MKICRDRMLDPELQASGLAALLLEVDGETHPAAVLLHDGKVLRDDLALLVTDAGAVLQEPCSLRRVVGGYATVTTLSFAAATGLSVQSLAAGASYRTGHPTAFRTRPSRILRSTLAPCSRWQLGSVRTAMQWLL